MILDVHLGVVMTNDQDQDKEFGIEARIDSLIPDEVYPVIIKPLFPANMVKVPDVGQIVEVIVPADEEDEFGESSYAGVEFAEHIYYRNRLFDSNKGKVPDELRQNYPKRAGMWFDNGALIIVDETKNREFILLRLKKNGALIKIEVDSDGNELIRIGSDTASEAILKGTTFVSNFNTFLTTWRTAMTALQGAVDPIVATYATTMSTALTTLAGQTNSWRSIKRFIDG
jgi:hypothetical protein